MTMDGDTVAYCVHCTVAVGIGDDGVATTLELQLGHGAWGMTELSSLMNEIWKVDCIKFPSMWCMIMIETDESRIGFIIGLSLQKRSQWTQVFYAHLIGLKEYHSR
jgi:hypothetical protein